jgi:sugar/nucleoside kinase (ribokinase family)
MSGGSAANTVIAFAEFGGKGAYKSVLGNDEMGKLYRDEFNKLGIVLSANDSEDLPTGTSFIVITPDSERTLITTLGANLTFNKDQISEELIARSEWIYLEGYKFSEEGGSQAIYRAINYAKKNNTKIAVSFSDKFIIDVFGDNLRNAVKDADLVFCNELEATTFTGKDNLDQAFEVLKKDIPNVAMTKGAEGSSIYWDGRTYEIPAYESRLTDTTGAGDMFAAGFMYGIIDKGNAELAGNLGSYAAAQIVSQYGPRYEKDLVELKNKIYSTFLD